MNSKTQLHEGKKITTRT